MTDTPPSGPELSPPLDAHDHPPYVAPEPRTSRSRLAALGLGLAAVVAAGVFAVAMLSAASGSATPEEAVERLFTAVGDEDVIGVLEALAPGERSALRPSLEELVGELRRLGIASDDLDLSAVRGVDLEFDGLALEREDMGGGVAAVRIAGGTITASTRPDQLPIGPILAKLLDHPDGGTELEPASTTEDLAVDAPVLVAIDDGDGWHVSLFYSVAEGLRRDAGEPMPAFGHGIEAVGADSPEEAVRQAVEAAVALDVRRLIASTSPAEARALHDYAPLFLDDAEAAVGELRAGDAYEIEVTRLDLTAETDGDVAQVRVGGFEASGTLPEVGDFSASSDGECFTFDFSGESDRTCASDMQMPGLPMGNTEMVLTTVRHDGRWFLSPTRTLFEQVLGGLRALDREDLDDPESFFGPFFGPLFGYGFGLGFAGGDIAGVPGEATSPFDLGPAPDPEDVPLGEDDRLGAECFASYEELPAAAGPEDYERAEREVDECLDRLWGE